MASALRRARIIPANRIGGIPKQLFAELLLIHLDFLYFRFEVCQFRTP